MRPGSAFCSASPRASSGGQSEETGYFPFESHALCSMVMGEADVHLLRPCGALMEAVRALPGLPEDADFAA